MLEMGIKLIQIGLAPKSFWKFIILIINFQKLFGIKSGLQFPGYDLRQYSCQVIANL